MAEAAVREKARLGGTIGDRSAVACDRRAAVRLAAAARHRAKRVDRLMAATTGPNVPLAAAEEAYAKLLDETASTAVGGAAQKLSHEVAMCGKQLGERRRKERDAAKTALSPGEKRLALNVARDAAEEHRRKTRPRPGTSDARVLTGLALSEASFDREKATRMMARETSRANMQTDRGFVLVRGCRVRPDSYRDEDAKPSFRPDQSALIALKEEHKHGLPRGTGGRGRGQFAPKPGRNPFLAPTSEKDQGFRVGKWELPKAY